MGHRNYSKYSGNFNKNIENKPEPTEPVEKNNPETVETVNVVVNEKTEIEFPIVEELHEGDMVTEEGIIRQVETQETVIGVVAGCEKLYVREKPGKEFNSVTIIPKNTEVKINLTESTEEFYKVTTSSGIEGYCMKQFISIK